MIGRTALLVTGGMIVAAGAGTVPAQDPQSAVELVRIVVGSDPNPDVLHAGTIEDALAAVAARRATERVGTLPAARIEVSLGSATFERTTSILIDQTMGGSPGAPTVLVGEGAHLVGARRVPPHLLRTRMPPDIQRRLPNAAAKEAARLLDLGAIGIEHAGPLVARGMGRPTQAAPIELYWNGLPLSLARFPDQGYLAIDAVIDPGSVPRDEEPDVARSGAEPGPPRGGTFRIADPRIERWRADGAWMHGYWKFDWADELLPIASIDPVAHTITLGLPHHYGLDHGARVAALNVLEELDRPGEYYIDADRNLIVIWPPGPADTAEIFASTLDAPLVLVRDAEHVVLRDLDLGACRGTALRIDGGAFVTVERCSVRAPGGHGIVLRGLRHRISACTVDDCGAAGITIDGGDRLSLTAGAHVVEDCDLARFGRLERTYRPGIAVSGVGHVIAHNRIHDAPHTAILLAGNEHIVEDNEIFAVLQETGDCGAIYAGRDWAMHGTVIRHNFIHDLPGTESRWQNAIYLDDMASGISVVGNLLMRCNLGMLIGGGRAVRIEHNVLVDCRGGITFDARGIGWMAPQIADPATSTLRQRLATLPITEPPWSERHPEVQRTLTDGFGRPVGSALIGNAFYRSPFGRVDDLDSVQVEGNRSFDTAVDPTATKWFDVREIPGFPAFRVDRYGPRLPAVGTDDPAAGRR